MRLTYSTRITRDASTACMSERKQVRILPRPMTTSLRAFARAVAMHAKRADSNEVRGPPGGSIPP